MPVLMPVKLTVGCISAILEGEFVENPVVQLLASKKITAENSQERYRLIISDGIHYHTLVILTSQLNQKIITGELSDLAVFRIDNYITGILPSDPDKKMILILNLTVIMTGPKMGCQLGEPKLYNQDSDTSSNDSSSSYD